MEKTKANIILSLIDKNNQILKEEFNYYKNTNNHMRTKEVLLDLIEETKLLHEIHYDLCFVRAMEDRAMTDEPKWAKSFEQLYEEPKKRVLDVQAFILNVIAEKLGINENN